MDSDNWLSVFFLLNGCPVILNILNAHILRTMITPENSKKKNTILLISRRLNILEVVLGCTRIAYHILQMLIPTSDYISEQHRYMFYTSTLLISCCVRIINIFFDFEILDSVARFFRRQSNPSTTKKADSAGLDVNGGYQKTLEWCLTSNEIVSALLLYALAVCI